MSAAEKAAARRKAILSRGNDRLAKLTTSARGENAPAYMHDGQSSLLHADVYHLNMRMQTRHFPVSVPVNF